MIKIKWKAGFEITMTNHCDGDILEHSFRLPSLKLYSNILHHSDFSSLFRTLESDTHIKVNSTHKKITNDTKITKGIYLIKSI